MATVKKGNFRPRKRRVVRRKPGQTMVKYFTMDTQDAIVRFQQAETPKEKEKIYVADIAPALNILVDNLINVYGFKVLHDSREELKMECVEFLYSVLHKFNADKGSKAFSYFNVVAKNWLTIKSKQSAKRTQTHVSLDDVEALTNADLEKIESYNFLEPFDMQVTQAQEREKLVSIIKRVSEKTRTDDERAAMDAIKQVVENLDDLEILSKRAVLLYLREISNLTPRQLSASLSSLKKHYLDIKKNDLN